MRFRRRRMVTNAALSLGRLSRLFRRSDETCDVEVGDNFERKDTISDETVGRNDTIDQKTFTETGTTPTLTPTSSVHNMPTSPPELLQRHRDSNQDSDHSSQCHHLPSHSRHFFLKELLKPAPIVIVFAIIIALVDSLKALFLPPSSTFQPRFRPVAPDGQPPLAFVLDTANFVGAACVPIGLICLGSALACLRVRSGEAFPRGAIAALALAKMVVTPLLGIGITRWFAHVGFVHRDDKVLQFVCMCVVIFWLFSLLHATCALGIPPGSVWECDHIFPCAFAGLCDPSFLTDSPSSLFSGLPTATTQVSSIFCF
jgi:hypothetical protein